MSTHPDAWLFLPPEVEALVPRLLARLTAQGDNPSLERELRDRVETLIVEGDVESWRAFLREVAGAVSTYDGDDDDAVTMLAAIVDDQFILARAVVDLEMSDLDARQQLASAVATRRPPD